jgi:hypothetical protein
LLVDVEWGSLPLDEYIDLFASAQLTLTVQSSCVPHTFSVWCLSYNSQDYFFAKSKCLMP